jgi:hypothetical protein
VCCAPEGWWHIPAGAQTAWLTDDLRRQLQYLDNATNVPVMIINKDCAEYAKDPTLTNTWYEKGFQVLDAETSTERERSIEVVKGLGDMYVDDPRFAGM